DTVRVHHHGVAGFELILVSVAFGTRDTERKPGSLAQLCDHLGRAHHERRHVSGGDPPEQAGVQIQLAEYRRDEETVAELLFEHRVEIPCSLLQRRSRATAV